MATLATETWTGTTGAAWPAQWTTGVLNGATATIQANAGRLTYGTATSFNAGAKAYLSGLTATRDLDVTLTVAFANLNEQYLWIALRCPDAAAGSTPTNAYFLNIYPGSSGAEFDKQVSGAQTNISGAISTGAWTAGVARNVRVQAVGNTLGVKFWNVGSSEPATWTWTGTDSSLSAATGKVWIGTFAGSAANTGSATLDDLTVTDGASAGGTVTLTGAGTLSTAGSGSAAASGTVALSGTGTLSTAGSSSSSTGTVALTGAGTLSTAGSGSAAAAGTVDLSGTGTLTISGSGPAAPPVAAVPPTVAVPRGVWSAFARGPGYALTEALPILEAEAVLRHMGLSKAVLSTPYTAARWSALQPSYGVALYRSGKTMFTGPVTSRTLTWSEQDGTAVIKVEAAGDEILLADRIAFPDPLRAADDQTVNDYWTYTGKASAAMRQLISDQAGATARADRQVTGLTLGVDPDVGTSRTWQGLFQNVLELLATISAASGVDLGVRVLSSSGALTATVKAPRNLVGTVTFSADLSNVGGISFTETAPEVTAALVAGQGDLHLRTRKLSTTTDPGATRWGRQVWSYVDRRDTADATVLTQAGTDALASGQAGVNLTIELLDSQAASYGTDWDLGDKVTVYVGLPGESKIAQVDDVVREITFTVDSDGAERIRPAVGSVNARTYLPTPVQRALANVAQRSAALARQK